MWCLGGEAEVAVASLIRFPHRKEIMIAITEKSEMRCFYFEGLLMQKRGTKLSNRSRKAKAVQ
jgi:hypothetical protein